MELPPLELEQPGLAFPTRGVVPCAHPMPRNVAFDAPTAVKVSAEEAFAQLDASCTAPFKWSASADAAAEETEVSVQVVLDRDSAVEVTFPTSDVCTNKLMVEGDVVLRTADGKLTVSGRGTFTYVPGAGPADDLLGPIELTVAAAALQGPGMQAAAPGRYVVRVGGGSACAGELRRQGAATAGSQAVVGSWSANGCPLGESAVDADSSPELGVRMEQLEKAWHEAHLDAAWDSGSQTELELDVNVSKAPICQDQRQLVSVPVDVRYGTSDGIIPVHDALGHVDFSLLSDEAAVRLLVTEETDCSTLPSPAPGYCESLSSASLRFEIRYPNAPSQRLARLVVDGQLRGSTRNATTQQLLTVAGTPYAVECLLTFDCAVDEICADGFCRAPAQTQTRPACAFDSDCGLSGHCRAGSCSSL